MYAASFTASWQNLARYLYICQLNKKIMRKTLLSFVMLVFTGGLLNAQAICGGHTVALQAQNPQGLTGVSYSMNPGGATDPNGLFVFTPSVTSSYTLYTSGTTSSAPFTNTTTSAVVQVTVYPQPFTAPTVTNLACNTTSNCWNLNLSFQPSITPQFTITWLSSSPTIAPTPPANWTNPQTGQCGTLSPGSWTAVVTTDAGCADTASFDILLAPAQANFSLNPSPNYVLTCFQPSMDISASNPVLDYTYNSASTGPITGPSVSVTFTNVGSWTVSAINSTSGCSKTLTFAVTQNTLPPTGIVTPTFQNITCTSTPVTVTMTAIQPTVNFVHYVYSPAGTTFQASNQVKIVFPPSVGIFTYVLFNSSTGCFSTKNFTVENSANNSPTFQITSTPGGFSLGCSSKSVATISFVNAQTNPISGGAISFTLLPPGDTTAVPPGTLSTNQVYSIKAPGSYTAVVMDNSNNCYTKLPFSVITNTFPPGVDSVVVPRSILDCENVSTIIEGFSFADNVSYSWSYPTGTGVGNVSGNQYTVHTNPFVPPSNVLIANYTLTVLENNNLCISRTVVPIYQNLYPPTALAIAGSPSITCVTTSVQLSNFSKSNVPTGTIFPTGEPVEATKWEGPSPSIPLLNSSTYAGLYPGTYTMAVRDRNNGCTSTGTVALADGVKYPQVANSFSTFIMDCGAPTATVYPVVTDIGASTTYSWKAKNDVPISNPATTPTITVFAPDTLYILITNTSNGCIHRDSMRVSSGSLTASIDVSKQKGYAPLTVLFSNNSTSKLGNSGIETVWSFGTDSVRTTTSVSIQPSYVYSQPGTYTITAYNRKGDCVDTAYAYVTVEIPSQMIIPNVFTPNNDGVNDLFFLQRSANLSEITAQIYDRWGNLVYEVTSTSGNIEWDGKTQYGKEAPSGTYFYIITAKGKDDQKFDEKGQLSLLR
jgi:gliding motility-associated-like protein